MDSIEIRLKLNVTHVPTWDSHIIDLPQNENIFEIFRIPEVIYIVDNDGNAVPYIAFITVVDSNDNELV